jgi:hypothetical protein
MPEETVYESDLIREKEPESQAEHAGHSTEMTMKEIETSGVCDGYCDRSRH